MTFRLAIYLVTLIQMSILVTPMLGLMTMNETLLWIFTDTSTYTYFSFWIVLVLVIVLLLFSLTSIIRKSQWVSSNLFEWWHKAILYIRHLYIYSNPLALKGQEKQTVLHDLQKRIHRVNGCFISFQMIDRNSK